MPKERKRWLAARVWNEPDLVEAVPELLPKRLFPSKPFKLSKSAVRPILTPDNYGMSSVIAQDVSSVTRVSSNGSSSQSSTTNSVTVRTHSW